MTKKVFLILLLALALAACGTSDDGGLDGGQDAAIDAGQDAGDLDGGEDAGEEDAGDLDAGEDAGEEDAGDLDAGEDAGDEDAGQDAGVEDAGEDGGDEDPEGWGVISGECGELDDEEWNSGLPYTFDNHIDFGIEGWVYEELSADGQEVYDDGNLGGSSIHSEVISFEMLNRCELAELIKTEGEILYEDIGGKKTDILVLIDERKVGVSVTRAFHYPPTEPCPLDQALDLMRSKLSDIPLSAANAAPEDAWERSMLHVVAYNQQCADIFIQAWEQLESDEPEVVLDTIVFFTVTDGDDEFAY